MSCFTSPTHTYSEALMTMTSLVEDLGRPVGLFGWPRATSAQPLEILYWKGDPHPLIRVDGRRSICSRLLDSGRDDPREGYLVADPGILEPAAPFGFVYWIGEVIWRESSKALVSEARLTEVLSVEARLQVHPYRDGYLLVGGVSKISFTAQFLAQKLVCYARTVTDRDAAFNVVECALQFQPCSPKAWEALLALAPDEETHAALLRERSQVCGIPRRW